MSILLLSSTIAALALVPEVPPSKTCTLSGTVELLGPGGKKLDPRVARVYVRTAIPDDTPPRHHQMLQTNYQFEPRVLVIKQGDFVDFLNRDGVSHEVHSTEVVNGFSLPKENAKDTTHSQQFNDVGISIIGCHLHSTMRATIITTPSVFHSAVGADGKWMISGLSEQRVEVVIWVPDRPEERIPLTPCVDKPISVSLRVPQAPRALRRYLGTEG